MRYFPGYGDEITWGGRMPYNDHEDKKDEAIENRLDEEFSENYLEHLFSEDVGKFQELLLKIAKNCNSDADLDAFKKEVMALYDQAFKKFSQANRSRAYRDLMQEYEEDQIDSCILLD